MDTFIVPHQLNHFPSALPFMCEHGAKGAKAHGRMKQLRKGTLSSPHQSVSAEKRPTLRGGVEGVNSRLRRRNAATRDPIYPANPIQRRQTRGASGAGVL